MGESHLVLLMLTLPSLLHGAIFNRNGLGEAWDYPLRFRPGEQRQHDTVIGWQPGDSDAPAFCNGLGCPKFTTISKTSTYELREYDLSRWVSTTSIGINYQEAEEQDFVRLFDYISGYNKKKEKIDMTAPVLNRIIPGQGPACADNFTMSFFMSPKVDIPPKPSDVKVVLDDLPKMRVYVRWFPGFASKEKWLKEAVQLAKDLPKEAQYHKGFYYTAGYNSPFQLTGRHNEIWFIAK